MKCKTCEKRKKRYQLKYRENTKVKKLLKMIQEYDKKMWKSEQPPEHTKKRLKKIYKGIK